MEVEAENPVVDCSAAGKIDEIDTQMVVDSVKDKEKSEDRGKKEDSGRKIEKRRERSRDMHRKSYRNKRDYKDYEYRKHRRHYSSESDSYEERRKRHREDKERSKRRRKKHYHRHSDSDQDRKKRTEKVLEYSKSKEIKDDAEKIESKPLKTRIIKFKGRGIHPGQGLRSWNTGLTDAKLPENPIKEPQKIITEEDWINLQLKEISNDLKKAKKGSPKWCHDKYERINRDSESEGLEELVRMSPPTLNQLA